MLRAANLITFSFVTFAALGFQAQACEVAHLKFEGTPFVTQNIQLEKQKIYFFRGERSQTSMEYSVDGGWCYTTAGKVPEKPAQGCLKPGAKRALRDSANLAVATLRVRGDSLFVNVVNESGKATGKQIQFIPRLEEGERILEVKGWNCPNPRFLSCAGADLKVLPVYVSVNESEVIPGAVELSQGSSHYQVSCRGVHKANRQIPDIGQTVGQN